MKTNVLNAYRAYKHSNAYDLYDVYGSFSRAKANAWRYCQELCDRYGGMGLKIVGANSQTFSIGFEYPDPETGVLMFLWHTAYNTYTAEIDAEALRVTNQL